MTSNDRVRDRPDSSRASVLHVTSNGHGMGHLARQAAVALSDRSQDGRPGGHAIASLSTAVPLLRGLGLATEYIAGFDRGQVPRARWDRYLADRLSALVDFTGARVLVFDADTPQQYPGVLMAAHRHPDLATVWCRRGFWHQGFDAILPWARGFDYVLEPGDLAGDLDDGPTSELPAHRVAPISMFDAVELSGAPALSRDQAAAELGLDPTRPAVLVSLGSGTAGSAAQAAQVALAHLAGRDWQVALTRAPLAGVSPLVDDPRVVVLAGVFPLARYLAAFDAAVISAGYNAVHEAIPAGLPTLVIPNPVWAIDNQHARARSLAVSGYCLYAHPADPEGITAALAKLLEPVWRDEQRARLATARRAGRLDVSGGRQVAAWLNRLTAPVGGNAISRDPVAAAMAHKRAKWLGRAGSAPTSWAFRVIGGTLRRAHPPIPGPVSPRRVDQEAADQSGGSPDSGSRTPLRFIAAQDPGDLREGVIVEDLLEEDPDYLRTRTDLAQRYYRVAGGTGRE